MSEQEHIRKHSALMESGRWRVDRSDPSGQVYYYPTGTVHQVKMILEDAYKMEMVLQEWSKK